MQDRAEVTTVEWPRGTSVGPSPTRPGLSVTVSDLDARLVSMAGGGWGQENPLRGPPPATHTEQSHQRVAVPG